MTEKQHARLYYNISIVTDICGVFFIVKNKMKTILDPQDLQSHKSFKLENEICNSGVVTLKSGPKKQNKYTTSYSYKGRWHIQNCML